MRDPVAVCRSCEWSILEPPTWAEDVEEEAMVHSVMLAHEVDVGNTYILVSEARERARY